MKKLLLFVLVSYPILFQAQVLSDSLGSRFETYSKLPREVVYAHLNKTSYIHGEPLAFTAYITDKATKKASNVTTNIYCTLIDSQGTTVKEQLLLAVNGVAKGGFDIDSLIPKGQYTFKVFTNWSRNFNEQNFFVESINVIDPQAENNHPISNSKTIDAQFLPEGGHLVSNVENTIGVVIKNEFGLGLAQVNGIILSSNNEQITTFKTNDLGIGKFILNPKLGEHYQAKITVEDTEYVYPIGAAMPKGIALSLVHFPNKIALNFKTNISTFEDIKDKPYILSVHNGSQIATFPVSFQSELNTVKTIALDRLNPGINIFTLFDDALNPILERLYFNVKGINILETASMTTKKDQDSTLVTIPIRDINPTVSNTFSISVLPSETKSYNHHHNILSYTYLQPYVKGYIEKAHYYFTDIDLKKLYDLDNLLITQGWSSYDWSTLFNKPPKPYYKFESGIDLKVKANIRTTGNYVMFPISYNGMESFSMEPNHFFEKQGLFPFEDDVIRISEFGKNNSLKPANVFMQFEPAKVPLLKTHHSITPLMEPIDFAQDSFQSYEYTTLDNIQQLNEVVISFQKKQSRMDEIAEEEFGTIDMFDTSDRRKFNNLETYFLSKGFVISTVDGVKKIINPTAAAKRSNAPNVYLDDMQLDDFTLLENFNMEILDYIVIDKSGIGEGMLGMAGVIKIFTDPTKNNYTKNDPTFQSIKIPLTFSRHKTYYAPKYMYNQTNFYKQFGVVDWISKPVNTKGAVTFKISNEHRGSLSLFIEGMTNDGHFLSEQKNLTLNP